MTGEQLDRFILDEAKLWLDGGTMFGPEGEGFQRINIACPRAVLEKAFAQLKHAIDRL
jgi:cystathionine beta-lyase